MTNLVNYDTIWTEWGGDILLNQNGGIQTASAWDVARQQIERILLNNSEVIEPSGKVVPADYIWHPTFGLGLRQFLGERMIPDLLSQMQAACLQAVLTNPAVAGSPAPIVDITADPTDRLLTIYIDVTLKNKSQGTVAIQAPY